MKTKSEIKSSDSAKKVSRFHADLQKWKSMLQFVEDGIVFIQRLLNSYSFLPNTPNLFERLQDYLQRIKHIQLQRKAIGQTTSRLENILSGILECGNEAFDDRYYGKHHELGIQIKDFMQDFQILKSEIFNYAGGILKKRKP